MPDYPDDYNQEELWGLGWPTGIVSSAAEELTVRQIARVMSAMLVALGAGIYEGGVGTIVDGNLQISAIGRMVDTVMVPGAVLPDSLGAVPVYKALTTLAATEFPAGDSYVHIQAGETAREDGGCGYYASVSDVPAPDALRVCKVTKVGAVLTAVDNSVQTPPAIEARLSWAHLVREVGSVEQLADYLLRVLGARYLGDDAPADVDARLTIIETAIGEGAGGGTVLGPWGLLTTELPGVSKTIRQGAREEAEAALADHVEAEHGEAGSTGGTTVINEQWDAVALNGMRLALQLIIGGHPSAGATMVDTVLVADGYFGHNEVGGVNYVDDVNSTF